MAAGTEQKMMAERLAISEIVFNVPFSPKKEMINPIKGKRSIPHMTIGP